MSTADMTQYDGMWVAVRDGKVIAYAPDEKHLRADPRVLAADHVFPIGDPPMGYMVNA